MASSVSFNKNDIAYPKVLADKLNKLASDSGGSENREIKVDGNDFLGSNTTPLNISGGTNVSLAKDTSTGKLTINSTVVNTDTHRPIKVDGVEKLGNNTTPLNLSGGTNVSLSYSSGKVTVNADIPKTQNELTYYNSASANTSPYNGLFTQQLMYDGGVVVSNTADYNTSASGVSDTTTLILRIDNNTVWKKNNGGVLQQVSGKTPLDYFKGSRLNMNSYTKKLFYSNGSRIYQIAGTFSD